jgi:dihydrofolate synthase / folylpolyglutamate synthase
LRFTIINFEALILPRFDYEKFSSFFQKKTRWTLRPTRALLKALKFKQSFRAIHIAGTNGKGSVAAFTESILRSSKCGGTGRYTSPHLARFNERIRCCGKEISNAQLTSLWDKAKPIIEKWNAREKEKISLFEAETAFAFKFFQNNKIEYAVVETGMGGRLDATNVLSPQIAVITRISLDHTAELGASVSKIAAEKAAIVKRGCFACVAEESSGTAALRIIKAKCKQQGVTLIIVGASNRAYVKISGVKATPNGTFFEVSGVLGSAKLRTILLGAHQAENAALAWTIAKILQQNDERITDSAIKKGIARAVWPGRLEIVSRSPLTVFDGAHNPSGAVALAASLKTIWPNKKWIILFAAMKDKDYANVLRALAPLADEIIATTVEGNERGASTAEIKKAAMSYGYGKKVLVEENAVSALKKAESLAGKKGAVLVCGSLYLIGELKRSEPRWRRKVF